MDTLDDEHCVASQLQFLTVPLTLASREVIFRNLHTLTIHQTRQVFFQQLIVHSLDVVEVIVAIRQLRRVYSVDEVVVGRERHGTQSAGQQLDAQTLAESGLSRR